jgi:hypothetical protein
MRSDSELVEYILERLRPLQVSEEVARAKVLDEIKKLPNRIVAAKAAPGTAAAIREAGDRIGQRVATLLNDLESLSCKEWMVFSVYGVDAYLSMARAACKTIKTAQALDARINFAKRVCAETAYDLIVICSKAKPTGTETGALMIITTALHEACTKDADSKDADFKRCIDEVLATVRHRDGSIFPDRRKKGRKRRPVPPPG